MKQLRDFFVLTILILSFTFTANAQTYSISDFTIKTKELSDKYAALFKESSKIEELVSVFNEINISHIIAPIVITVSYENKEGSVLAEINYDHEKVFSESSDYKSHDDNFSGYGTGISVSLQDQLFTALSEYKRSVATQGWTMDNDLLKFESAIKLKKTNGDWAQFYAFNKSDSRGTYSYVFYTNVRMQIGGKLYMTETSNNRMLNEMKYFFVGKTSGIDGNKTGAYYFCKFFNIKAD